MLLADCHFHTLCSPDSSEPLENMAAAALEMGMGEVCVTDHCDLMDLHGQLDRSFSWDPLLEQFRRIQPRFAEKLPIRLGLELGEAWEDPELARRIVGRTDLDFVIGSVHNLSHEDGGIDFYYVHYENAEHCHRVLRSYFDCMETLSRMDCFDVLGHVIYPLRYMNDRDGNQVTLEPYYPQLERIFRAVIAKDKGIEVNTNRGRTLEPWREVLALYKDCGGRIVTLGSDAHRREDMALGIAQAAKLLGEFGLSPAVYRRRKVRL